MLYYFKWALILHLELIGVGESTRLKDGYYYFFDTGCPATKRIHKMLEELPKTTRDSLNITGICIKGSYTKKHSWRIIHRRNRYHSAYVPIGFFVKDRKVIKVGYP